MLDVCVWPPPVSSSNRSCKNVRPTCQSVTGRCNAGGRGRETMCDEKEGRGTERGKAQAKRERGGDLLETSRARARSLSLSLYLRVCVHEGGRDLLELRRRGRHTEAPIHVHQPVHLSRAPRCSSVTAVEEEGFHRERARRNGTLISTCRAEAEARGGSCRVES